MSLHRAESRGEPLNWGRSEETDEARQPQKVGGMKAYGREFAKGFVITALVLAVLAIVAVGGGLAIKYTCGFEAAGHAIQNAVDLAMKKIISIKDMTFTPVEVMKYFVAPAIGGLLVVALIGGGAAMGVKAIRDSKEKKKEVHEEALREQGRQEAMAHLRGRGYSRIEDGAEESAEPLTRHEERRRSHRNYGSTEDTKGKDKSHRKAKGSSSKRDSLIDL